MKKQITLIQESASPVVFDDSDDRSLDEYTKEMARLLESNNVSIIHTSSCSVITRPNKVTSIVVREFPSSDEPKAEQQLMKQEVEKAPEDSPDGIITD